jgi:secreted trypsin-like serine protease
MRFKLFFFSFLIFLNLEGLFTREIDCGLRNGTSGFIFGGEEVQRGDWPWAVALAHKIANTFFCSASLFTKKHALSGEEHRDEMRSFSVIFNMFLQKTSSKDWFVVLLIITQVFIQLVYLTTAQKFQIF